MRSFGASLLGKWLLLFTLSLTAGSAFASRPVGNDLDPLKLEPTVLQLALPVELTPGAQFELVRSFREQGADGAIFIIDENGSLRYFGEVHDYVRLDMNAMGIGGPVKPMRPCCPKDAELQLPVGLQRELRELLTRNQMAGVAVTIHKGKLVEFSNYEKLLRQEAMLKSANGAEI